MANGRICLLPLIFILLLTPACERKNVDAKDDDSPRTTRGRLAFAKGLNSLRVGDRYVFRDVSQYLLVNGKPWAPDNDKEFAGHLNWCDTSPNPAVEILRCFDDASKNYRNTYIIRMNGDQPEVQTINEKLGSVWIDDDGRWLLFRKRFLNVETGEERPIKGMPWADDPDGSAPVQYVIGVSPDMGSVVGMSDSVTTKEGKDEYVTLQVIDTISGVTEIRRANFTKYPWLKDHEDPKKDIQPPPKPGRKFVWKKDPSGRDRLSVPELFAMPKKK